MNEIERWKPVVGFEGLYEVSDQGRVRSLDREVPGSNRHGPFVQKLRGRELKLTVSTHGYLRVSLWRDGKMTGKSVHRLVLEAFRGSCPPNHQACHWDDNPSNNRLSNLRWDTSSANRLDSVRNGSHNHARKTHCPKGHEFDDENTYVEPDGKRRCRACKRAQDRAYKARRQAKKREAYKAQKVAS